MSNRNDYFFKQTVQEAELDAGFAKLEEAVFKTMSDQLLQGVFQGAAVTEQLTPSLSVDADGPALIYDQLGRRIFWSPVQAIDCSVDEASNPTTVVGGGNAKVLSVFAEFDRLLSDPRIDGNGATVYFVRDEYFKLNVVQGAEATSGAEVAPPLRASQILLCDITILQGTTQIFDADIDMTTRRQDTFVITGSPNSEREGTVKELMQAFQDQINAFIGTALPAATVTTAGSPAWADTTANPASNAEAQFDKIVTDLAVGAGSAKIQAAAGPVWHDATTNPAERLDQRTDSIITDLTANAGADRVGVAASPAGLITVGGSIQDALAEIEARLNREDYHSMPIEAANPLQMSGIGGATAWSWTESGTSNAGNWETSQNSQVLLIPCPIVNSAVTITEFILYGVGAGTNQVTASLIHYPDSSGVPTRVVIGTVTGDLGGVGSALGVAGLTHDSNLLSGRYAIEVYSGATAGLYAVHNVMLRWVANF